jgi:hypothetical protein
MSLQRVGIPTPNYSGRGGVFPRLIVFHTTEGARNFRDLGAYFANPATQASSHVGIDDTPGQIGEYVQRSGKAWTQANANPYCVAAELCAFAKWTAADWATHPQMLANAAAWAAEESTILGIPLVGLSAAQAQDGRSAGVCQHNDLGAAGGGHWDCGTGFPIAQVLAMASGQTMPGGGGDMVPYPPSLSGPMIASASVPGGYYMAGADGGVFSFGGAAFFGSLGDTTLNAPIVAMMAVPDGTGYWLVAADGGVFTFGSATFYGGLGDVVLDYPVTAAELSDTACGYRLTASDGGVFTFGDAYFYGSAA